MEFRQSNSRLPNTQTSYLGPYKATRLWNDVLQAFRNGVPIGKHRRYMKSYDDCFVASEAVTWLHQYLQSSPNFGPAITRQKTVLLLQKFHKANVFEDVREQKNEGGELSDGNRLYRLVPVIETPGRPACGAPPRRTLARAPLAMRTSLMNSAITSSSMPHLPGKKEPMKPQLPLQNCVVREDLIQRPGDCGQVQRVGLLTAQEVEQVWRTQTLQRLGDLLSLDSIEEVMEPTFVHTAHIIHNMTQVNKNGIVSNIDKKDQLPHWVLSAMRCLAYWPDKVDDFPDYPGFEKDVFKVVKQYFEALQEPLTTFAMYEVFINVMVTAENRSSRHHANPRAEHLTSFASVENLMLNLTMNATVNEVQPPQEIMIVHDEDPQQQQVQQQQQDSYQHRSFHRNLSGTNVAKFETSFGMNGRQEPQTRVCHNVDDLGYCSNSESSSTNQGPATKWAKSACPPNGYTIGLAKSAFGIHGVHSAQNNSVDNCTMANRERCKSMADINRLSPFPENNLSQQGRVSSSSTVYSFGTDKEDNRLKYGLTVAVSTTPKFTSSSSDPNSKTTNQNGHIVRNDPDYFDRNGGHQRRPHRRSDPPPYVPPPAYKNSVYSSTAPTCQRANESGSSCRPSESDSSYTSARSHLTPPVEPALPPYQKPTSRVTSESYRIAVDSSHMPYATTPVGRALFGGLRKAESSPNLNVLQPSVESRVQDSLQVCLLLLPPPNRRKIHLLLRLMHKMINNKHLNLNASMSTRRLLLQTFSRCILRCQDEADYDELLTMHTLSFMIDHYQELMKVPQPLKHSIEQSITTLRRTKTQYQSGEFPVASPERGSDVQDATHPQSPVTFCAQVSIEQYEVERLNTSQLALAELLEGIIINVKMPAKDKKKRLKQFAKSYPEIYKKRFPTPQSEAAIFPSKPRIKQPLLVKLKLRNIRL